MNTTAERLTSTEIWLPDMDHPRLTKHRRPDDSIDTEASDKIIFNPRQQNSQVPLTHAPLCIRLRTIDRTSLQWSCLEFKRDEAHMFEPSCSDGRWTLNTLYRLSMTPSSGTSILLDLPISMNITHALISKIVMISKLWLIYKILPCLPTITAERQEPKPPQARKAFSNKDPKQEPNRNKNQTSPTLSQDEITGDEVNDIGSDACYDINRALRSIIINKHQIYNIHDLVLTPFNSLEEESQSKITLA